MVKMEGKYKHIKNENLDEYFTAVGVPYVPRKMMLMSAPTVEVKRDGEHWIIINSSMMRTTEIKFKIGEEYIEKMPDAELKSITTIENDSELLTVSQISGTDTKNTRRYTFSDDGLIISLTHDKCATPAKRYFERVKE